MPRFAILVFPGSNCEGDVLYALRDVLGQEAELVWHKETSLDGFDAALLPGRLRSRRLSPAGRHRSILSHHGTFDLDGGDG